MSSPEANQDLVGSPDQTPNTVADVERLFMQFPGDISSQHGSALDVLRSHRRPSHSEFGFTSIEPIRDALISTCYLNTLAWMKVMINRTRHSLHLVTGSDRLARVLAEDFDQMLHHFDKHGGDARVVVVDGNSEAFNDLHHDHKQSLRIAKATASQPFKHFLVGDDCMVREEELHNPISDNSSSTVTAADVYCNNDIKAKRLKTWFDVIWKRVT